MCVARPDSVASFVANGVANLVGINKYFQSIPQLRGGRASKLFINNLLFRIQLIIWMILVDRPCAMGV
jgi:hypothetical protein